jgi:hypothetical protein
LPEQRLCLAAAHAEADVARAALTYRRSTRARNGIKLLTAQATAAHAQARQQCLTADDPTTCDAQATRTASRAVSDAEARWASGQADIDALRDAGRFEYDDLVARCDSRIGDAKARCLWSAAWQYDQPPPAASAAAR